MDENEKLRCGLFTKERRKKLQCRHGLRNNSSVGIYITICIFSFFTCLSAATIDGKRFSATGEESIIISFFFSRKSTDRVVRGLMSLLK